MNGSTLFCMIRQEEVTALPEEIVRQRFLLYMINDRGFPASLIVLEKSLKLLPHLSPLEVKDVPDRRADLLCFAKEICNSPLYPLLLVECKAVKLTKACVSQVIGYNYYVKACFIAIVNQEEVRFGYYDKERLDYVFLDYLPSYEELLIASKGMF